MPYQEDEMSHVNKVIEVGSIFGLQDLRGGVEEVDPTNLLANEEESNNIDRGLSSDTKDEGVENGLCMT